MKIPKYLIFLAVITLLLIVPFCLTARSESCATCHEMKPYYETWKESFHNKWSCNHCHQRPGIIGYAAFRAGFIYEAFATVFDYHGIKNPGARRPETESCLGPGCHSRDLPREVSTDGLIKVSHRIHIYKVKKTCVYCHRNIVHGETGPPPRKLCKECHKDEIKSDCEYCHVLSVPGIYEEH